MVVLCFEETSIRPINFQMLNNPINEKFTVVS